MKANTVQDNELYVRCPFCGDSENNLRKAHFSIHLSKYVYYCYRCGVSGRLKANQIVDLLSLIPNLDIHLDSTRTKDRLPLETILDNLLPVAGSSRKSALERWSYEGQDAFLSRSAGGQVVGVQLRHPDKKEMRTYGIRAFGFVGDMLLSSPSNPLRIVEGTYDVLTPQDVCVFGTIHYKALAPLKGHYIVLCPDGDVWQKPDLAGKLIGALRQLTVYGDGRGAYVQHLEYIADGKDPDEVPVEDRQVVSVADVLGAASTLTKKR